MRARLLNSSRATLLVLVSLAGCSSATPHAVPTVAAPGAGGSAGTEAESLPELTPVAAPENIVGVATLRAPARTLDTAMSWTGLGVDWRALVQAGPGAAFLPVLDLEAPIDVVVTIDPKVKNRPRALFAASVGLNSRQAALEAFQGLEMPVEFVEPGVHSVQPNAKTFCFVAAALGKARARLVCGEDRESVELLSPYLTRGNPSEKTGDADLHVELRAEAPWRLFGEKTQFLKLGIPMLLGEVSIGNADFDAALRDAATSLVDELILGLGELKDLRLDARLLSPANAPEQNELEVELGVAFTKARSWVASRLAGGEGHTSVAPDAFWKLPGDATQALYYSASDPDAAGQSFEVLERLFVSGLGHLGAAPALQRAWPQAFKEMLRVSGPLVSARGSVPPELLPKVVDDRERLRSSLGYTLIGVEDPQGRYGALLEQTLRLYEDPTLRKSLSQKYGVDAAKLPKAQSKKGPARLAESRSYEVALPAALYAEMLGDKTLDPAKLGGPLPLVIITFRDGPRTWIGFSSYAQLIEERLTALVATSSPSTLQNRAGLERLRRDRGNVAGYWTLAGISADASLRHSDLEKLLGSLGRSQVPVIGRAYGQAAGPSGVIQIHVPAQLFRDIATSAAARQ